MCNNKVAQVVASGYSYKTVMMRCGSTSVIGDTLLCDECRAELEKRYPQGWRNHPGDVCPHGQYVGDAGGPDILCGACESGDEDYSLGYATTYSGEFPYQH